MREGRLPARFSEIGKERKNSLLTQKRERSECSFNEREGSAGVERCRTTTFLSA